MPAPVPPFRSLKCQVLPQRIWLPFEITLNNVLVSNAWSPHTEPDMSWKNCVFSLLAKSQWSRSSQSESINTQHQHECTYSTRQRRPSLLYDEAGHVWLEETVERFIIKLKTSQKRVERRLLVCEVVPFCLSLLDRDKTCLFSFSFCMFWCHVIDRSRQNASWNNYKTLIYLGGWYGYLNWWVTDLGTNTATHTNRTDTGPFTTDKETKQIVFEKWQIRIK